MKIHSPLPEALSSEFTKAASILDHFIKGTNKFDQTLIPSKIIANCKGVAVLTLLKAGFVWSGRAGAGLVVARLPDGRWSAPCAIGAAGAGFGAQIGAELTDVVFILNTDGAVRAFSHGGNVTLGANVSVAAGPVGRQAEGAGTVANLAPIYSYSKTKGLFAGFSLEGLVIITRKETNATFYGQKVSPKELLSGVIEPPPGAEVLYRALNYRGFGSKTATTGSRDSVTGSSTSSFVPPRPGTGDSGIVKRRSFSGFSNSRQQAAGAPPPPSVPPKRPATLSRQAPPAPSNPVTNSGSSLGSDGREGSSTNNLLNNSEREAAAPYRSATVGAKAPPPLPAKSIPVNGGGASGVGGPGGGNVAAAVAAIAAARAGGAGASAPPPVPGGKPVPMAKPQMSTIPPRASSSNGPPPAYTPKPAPPVPTRNLDEITATAAYDFEGERAGDLSFKRGDTIVITKQTPSVNDWWEGRVGARTGAFPANYVTLN